MTVWNHAMATVIGIQMHYVYRRWFRSKPCNLLARSTRGRSSRRLAASAQVS
jgi:hypothetical protein